MATIHEPTTASADRRPPDHAVIEVHLRELNQLFDSLDPSPFHEKDLDRKAEEYIVDSAKELHAKTLCELVLYMDQPPSSREEDRGVEDAIRVHFARRARLLQRQLRRLIRRGLISFVIGLIFLATVFTIAHTISRVLGESAVTTLARESLIIVGWVALWRPLEIFLYDWWPILGERRLHDRLSRIKVRIVHHGAEHGVEAAQRAQAGDGSSRQTPPAN
jgi:hypothetical protein